MTFSPDIAIEQFLARHPLGNTPSGCLVGFSGGCDSTALLTALAANPSLRGTLTAVHFQHGIRGDSAEEDARWCRQFCHERGIPFRIVRLDVPHTKRRGESVEQCARRRRLESWEQLRVEYNLPDILIFLAHHQDDALEELFLRLGRGANASGLTSLRPVRRIHHLVFLRPFLNLRKCELEQYLHAQGITQWRLDATNGDNAYRRNAVRNRLLPLFRDIFQSDQSLVHALDALAADAQFLEASAQSNFTEANESPSLADWQTLPDALLPRMLRLALTRHFGDEAISITRDALARLKTALATFDEQPLTVPITQHIMARVTQRGVAFRHTASKRAAPPFQPIQWNWQNAPTLSLPALECDLTATPAMPDGIMLEARFSDGASFRERFSVEKTPAELTIRTWKNGDTMRPFGAAFQKKLQDIFTDAKIPREKRSRLPVILANSEIIWIPGVRRAEFGRV